ncbi:MAG: CRTAC1 family protein [Acidobacteriaceae bacterium]|nr:CRTAC1 family protein [Acidobacteriaceae bacterium]
MKLALITIFSASCALLLLSKGSPPGRIEFRDVTEKAGIRSLIISGGTQKNYVLEVNGSGACWFDYNNDGYPDLYLVNGSTLEALQGKKPRPATNHLYRNNRNGTFTDVTEAAHVPGSDWGFGCVAADYDNDGRTDLLVTNFGPNILYHNNGDGTFTEVASHAGVSGGNIWHTGAAFGDYDNDGYVDLYVAGYLDFNVKNPELKTCDYRGVKVHACGPLGYRGAPDALYHNNRDGTFTEVTEKAHVVDRNLYFGFTVIFDDFDDDGLPDIFVANDSNPNYLYRNKGDGTFEEVGVSSGVAYNSDGKEMSSMGVAAGDYDNDGRTDLFVTTFANDNYVLYHNDGKGSFSDLSFQSGIGERTIPYLGWATFFFDYNNDGWKDLFNANGHVYPEMGERSKESYREPLQLFQNLHNGKFAEVSQEVGLRALPLHSARGGAYCDYDNDGDVDIVVSNIDDQPQLLENVGGNRSNWLQLKLKGTKSNRDAIGAKVKLTAGDLVQYDRIRAGGSYISGNDLRLHFGLANHATADSIEITWPSGTKQRLTEVKSNQILTITEPQ